MGFLLAEERGEDEVLRGGVVGEARGGLVSEEGGIEGVSSRMMEGSGQERQGGEAERAAGQGEWGVGRGGGSAGFCYSSSQL